MMQPPLQPQSPVQTQPQKPLQMFAWSKGALDSLAELQRLTVATDQEMANLKLRINGWFNGNPGSACKFAFEQHPNIKVSATMNGGTIRSVSFGDN